MLLATWIENWTLRRQIKTFRRLPFAEGTRFLELDRYLIRYRLLGDGPTTVVFIPNYPNHLEHYAELEQLLRKFLSHE